MRHNYPITVSLRLLTLLLVFLASCEKGPNFREFNYPPPVVEDFFPKQGYVGSDITITGADFGSLPRALKVYFGGVLADTIRSAEDDKIVVQVPSGGISGTISVEYFGKTATTAESFTLLPSARFTALSTDKAMAGDEVTITGENFGEDISKVQVFIGERETEVLSVNPTTIVFLVPDVPSGSVRIIVDGQQLTGSYLMVGMEKLSGTLIGHEGSYNNNPANTIAAAVDGDLNTFIDGPTASGFVGYDLGAGKAAVLKSVRYAPRSTHASRMVDGEIRGANDPTLSDYTVLYKITETPPAGVYTEQQIETTESYRYIYYYAPSGNCNIAEIEFYGNIIDRADPVGKYIWEFIKDGDNEGWVPQQDGNYDVTDGAMHVSFTQTSGNKRADLKQTQLPVTINTGTYPIVAMKFTKPEGARVTFDTNNGSVGNGFNKYATDYVSQQVYYWDLSTQSLGTSGAHPNETISFSTFQFKIADTPQTDPATGYEVEWIRTFESKEALAAFLGL